MSVSFEKGKKAAGIAGVGIKISVDTTVNL